MGGQLSSGAAREAVDRPLTFCRFHLREPNGGTVKVEACQHCFFLRMLPVRRFPDAPQLRKLLHLLGRQLAPERARVLGGLLGILGAGDGDCALGGDPCERHLSRRAAVPCSHVAQLGQKRLELAHREGAEAAPALRLAPGRVLAGEPSHCAVAHGGQIRRRAHARRAERLANGGRGALASGE